MWSVKGKLYSLKVQLCSVIRNTRAHKNIYKMVNTAQHLFCNSFWATFSIMSKVVTLYNVYVLLKLAKMFVLRKKAQLVLYCKNGVSFTRKWKTDVSYLTVQHIISFSVHLQFLAKKFLTHQYKFGSRTSGNHKTNFAVFWEKPCLKCLSMTFSYAIFILFGIFKGEVNSKMIFKGVKDG